MLLREREREREREKHKIECEMIRANGENELNVLEHEVAQIYLRGPVSARTR